MVHVLISDNPVHTPRRWLTPGSRTHHAVPSNSSPLPDLVCFISQLPGTIFVAGKGAAAGKKRPAESTELPASVVFESSVAEDELPGAPSMVDLSAVLRTEGAQPITDAFFTAVLHGLARRLHSLVPVPTIKAWGGGAVLNVKKLDMVKELVAWDLKRTSALVGQNVEDRSSGSMVVSADGSFSLLSDFLRLAEGDSSILESLSFSVISLHYAVHATPWLDMNGTKVCVTLANVMNSVLFAMRLGGVGAGMSAYQIVTDATLRIASPTAMKQTSGPLFQDTWKQDLGSHAEKLRQMSFSLGCGIVLRSAHLVQEAGDLGEPVSFVP